MLDYPLVRTGISIDDALAELTDILGFGVETPELCLDKCQFVRYQIDRLNWGIQIFLFNPIFVLESYENHQLSGISHLDYQDHVAPTVQRLQQCGFGEIVAARVTARTNDP